MGIATRFYIFLDDGSLRRVPQRIGYELPFGRDAIPEFAGTRQRVATVLVESEDGKPLRILDSRGLYWAFNAEGRIDDDIRQQWAEHLDVLSPRAASKKGLPVVDLVPEIKRRERQARYEWQLSVEDLDRIAADIWPGVHGPAPEIESVKGAKPKKPALTSEGKMAVREILGHLDRIKSQLAGMSERALKGIAFEALRTASYEWDSEALWRAVAEEAKRCEAIRAAHRTGCGEWYAVIEVARALPDFPNAWEHVTSAHEKCSTRKEAIEAARRLVADKSDWIDADREINVNVRSALEWRPDELD